MPYLKTLVSPLALILVAGCASTPEPVVTQELTPELNIQSVEVEIPETTEIWWGRAKRDYIAEKGCGEGCDETQFFKSEEVNNAAKERLRTIVKSAYETELVNTSSGTQAAKAVVTVNRLRVASAAQSALVGGGHSLNASVVVTEVETGEQIAALNEIGSVAGVPTGGLLAIAFEAGSRDPVVRMAEASGRKTCEALKITTCLK